MPRWVRWPMATLMLRVCSNASDGTPTPMQGASTPQATAQLVTPEDATAPKRNACATAAVFDTFAVAIVIATCCGAGCTSIAASAALSYARVPSKT